MLCTEESRSLTKDDTCHAAEFVTEPGKAPPWFKSCIKLPDRECGFYFLEAITTLNFQREHGFSPLLKYHMKPQSPLSSEAQSQPSVWKPYHSPSLEWGWPTWFLLFQSFMGSFRSLTPSSYHPPVTPELPHIILKAMPKLNLHCSADRAKNIDLIS